MTHDQQVVSCVIGLTSFVLVMAAEDMLRVNSRVERFRDRSLKLIEGWKRRPGLSARAGAR